jgi:hypothetical protein
MKKYTIILAMSLLCISCTSVNVVKKNSSTIIVNTNNNEFTDADKNIFISGYLSNTDYHFDNHSVSIRQTDAICFYKIRGKDNYEYVPSNILFYDLSKQNDFGKFEETNIRNIDPMDKLLTMKRNQYLQQYKSIVDQHPISIYKYDFMHDNKTYNSKGLSDIFYKISFPYSKAPLNRLIKYISNGEIVFTDLVYIESHPKNFIVNKVELDTGILNNYYFAGLEKLRWDFIEQSGSNILVIYYDSPDENKSESLPINFTINVYGVYTK